MNFSTPQMLIGFPVLGALGGLGMGMSNKYYGHNLYGNSTNDPFIGSSWDFVVTGASIGGGAALLSAGIKHQAQQIKLQQYSDTTRKMMAMSGMNFT